MMCNLSSFFYYFSHFPICSGNVSVPVSISASASLFLSSSQVKNDRTLEMKKSHRHSIGNHTIIRQFSNSRNLKSSICTSLVSASSGPLFYWMELNTLVLIAVFLAIFLYFQMGGGASKAALLTALKKPHVLLDVRSRGEFQVP